MKKTVILLLFLATGCSFLDEHPRDQKQREEVITSETTLYLNTLGHLYGMIGSNKMGEGLAGTYRGVYDLNTFTTDEAMLPTRSGDWYDGGLWQRLYLHTWETGEEPVKNAWNYLYKVIVMANQAIVDLKDYPAWKQEARALRAMYYYYLLDLFGRVNSRTGRGGAGSCAGKEQLAGHVLWPYHPSRGVVPAGETVSERTRLCGGGTLRPGRDVL